MDEAESAVESADDRDRRRLGLRLRELRRLRGLTTRALAAKSGVSSSMINQIETGTSGASVSSLRRIAAGLDVPLAEFFLTEEPAPAAPATPAALPDVSVVRRPDRRRLQLPESHIVYELLTPDLASGIEFVWIELEPGHPPVEAMSHPGRECCVVIAGTLTSVIGGVEYTLSAGDSIVFDCSIPHTTENRGDDVVVQISAISPPRF
jgi:transcriptional regulator with XRE-family HTH domain